MVDYLCYFDYYLEMNDKIIKSKYFHSIINFIESILTLSIYYDDYKICFIDSFDNVKHYEYIEKFISTFNKDEKIIYILLLAIYLIVLALYLLFFKLKKYKKFSVCFLNFTEFFHIRLFMVIYLTSGLNFNNRIFLFSSLFVHIIFVLITMYHINLYHLPFYSIKYIHIPFDHLTSLLDIYNLFIKFFLSLSNCYINNQYISKIFFYICLVVTFFFNLYIIYIMFNHSYYFMNNIFINKIKCSFLFINSCLMFTTILFGYIFSNLIILINAFITLFILIQIIYFYEPYKYMKIKRSDHIENIYNYFFSFFSDDFYKFNLLKAKIEEHRSKCGIFQICRICHELNKTNKTKSIYKIIYNEKNKYFEFINYLLHELNDYKLSELSENHFFIINIILLIYKYKELDLTISLNLNALYEYANIKNEQVISKNAEIIERLNYIQKFIAEGQDIIFQINQIINVKDGNYNLDEFFLLSYSLDELKSDKYQNYLFKSKNNEATFNITICSIFFEELFNNPVGQNFLQIRENLSQYEDSLNLLFEHSNKITLKFNLITNEILMIQAGKDLYEYLNQNLVNIFPITFRQYQIDIFKRELMKELKKESDIENETEEEDENKHLESNLNDFILPIDKNNIIIKLIINRNNNNNLYGILNLELQLLLNSRVNEVITLNGFYLLTKNHFITYKKDFLNKDLMFGICTDNFIIHNPENVKFPNLTLSRFCKDNGIKKKKLTKFFHFKLNGLIFSIYNYNQGNRKESMINFEENKNNKIGDTYLMKYNAKNDDTSSVAQSISSMANYSGGGSLKGLKINAKKANENNAKNIFHFYQKILFIINISLFIVGIINYVIKNIKYKDFFKDYEIFSTFREIDRFYLHSITSLILILCTIKPDDEPYCSYLNDFNIRFNKQMGNFTLNFTTHFFRESPLKLNKIYTQTLNLQKSLYKLNDKKTNALFNEYIEYHQLILTNNYFLITKKNITFLDALQYYVNSFSIIIKTGEICYSEPFYLVNSSVGWKNLYFKNNLKEWQIEFYNIIINFNSYCEKYITVHDEFNDIILSYFKEFKIYTFLFITLNITLLIIFIFILNVLIINFINITLNIFNSLAKKINNPEFNLFYKKKIENLSILLSIYRENPVKIIEKLEDNISNYKARKKEIIKNKNSPSIIMNIPPPLKPLELSEENNIAKIYYNILYFIIVYTIIYSLLFILIWIYYFNKFNKVFDLIKINSEVEIAGNRDLTLYQLMLYANITQDSILNTLGRDGMEDMSQTLNELYKIFKNRKSVPNLYLPLSSLFTISCDDFYENVMDTVLENIKNKYPNEKLYDNLKMLCRYYKIIDYNSNQKIYEKYFFEIYQGFARLNKTFDIDEVIDILKSDEYNLLCIYALLVFRPVLRANNLYVFDISILNIQKIIIKINRYEIIVNLIFDFILLIITIFILSKKINLIFHNINRLKSVFLICKSN